MWTKTITNRLEIQRVKADLDREDLDREDLDKVDLDNHHQGCQDSHQEQGQDNETMEFLTKDK